MDWGCGHLHIVELVVDEEPAYTIWRHGEGEAAMVVTQEMRDEWNSEGKSGVHEMLKWIERVHEYGGRL